MATGTATVTGKTGPAISLTSGVFTGLNGFFYDFVNQVVKLFQGSTEIIIDTSANTTTTLTFANNTYTLTIS